MYKFNSDRFKTEEIGMDAIAEYDLISGDLYIINKTAKCIMDNLLSGMGLKEIACKIIDDYKIDAEMISIKDIEADVKGTIDQLLHKQILIAANNDNRGGLEDNR